MAHLTPDQQALYRILGEDRLASAERFYMADIDDLNGSGVQAQALLTVDEDANTLTVVISAKGLEPGMVHPQHIHGFLDGRDANVPTQAADDDGDGFIELAEGADTYGPVLLSLTSPPGGELSGFPTAPDGSYLFSQTYQLPAGDLPIDPMLWLREIVIHGLTVPDGVGAGTPGEVDGSNGYLAVLPVAAGEIEAITAGQAFAMFKDMARDEFADASSRERLQLNKEIVDERLEYNRSAFDNRIGSFTSDVQDSANDMAESLVRSIQQSVQFGGGWSFG